MNRFLPGIVCACISLVSAADNGAASASLLKPGTPAPGFSLPDIAGKREALSIWCGPQLSKPFQNATPRLVILSFWATYCAPCQKEIPILQAFYEKHKADSLKIFLVSIDEEGAPLVAPFVADKKYTLPVLLDPYKKTSERFGVKALPSLFFISPDGVVRFSSAGLKPGTDMAAALEDIYAAVKAGKPVPASLMSGGESVAVASSAPAAPATPAVKPPANAQQKLAAALKVLSGTKVDTVARELGCDTAEVKKWADELKAAAGKLWGEIK